MSNIVNEYRKINLEFNILQNLELEFFEIRKFFCIEFIKICNIDYRNRIKVQYNIDIPQNLKEKLEFCELKIFLCRFYYNIVILITCNINLSYIYVQKIIYKKFGIVYFVEFKINSVRSEYFFIINVLK